jgi:ABC-type nitrate/sulfonate/bicarbonate transport system substrate-binding protein
MLDNKLFEKYAETFSYDLTVDYRDYPSAMPQVEAFVSGNLDLGMWGNTPIIRAIAAKQPWTVLNVGEGHFRFIIGTRPDSGIRNTQDLKGKTVGVLLGGDPYNAFSQILLHELGSGDPKAHDIKIINTPTQAQAATIPRGMDAAMLIYPAFLKAQKEVGTVGIINSFGYTEDHYRGPAGEGGGILLESVKKSAFYPDGYYLHRSFWMVQDKLLESHPQIIVAFVMAQQEAVAKLSTMDPGAVATMVNKYWGLPPELGAKVVKDEVLFIRGWVWPTEGDASAVLEISKFMVEGRLIEKPLTWKQVKDSMAKAAPLLKEAYERSGKKPDPQAFLAKDVPDVRGLPVWEMEKWKERT